MTRIGYLGPAGTFSEEAVIRALGEDRSKHQLLPLPSIYDTVLAVHDDTVEFGLVPVENSLEGAVNATLDALVMEATDVQIVGEIIHPVEHCLVARSELPLKEIEVVISHSQPIAQCRNFLRAELPAAELRTVSSTAEAVKLVAESKQPWAALGNGLAANIYHCRILRSGVEDSEDNATRFIWLSKQPPTEQSGTWKTSLVFWEREGADEPGWLVNCLSEFAERGINLTRIESRPRKQGLGQYMFFVDLQGRDTDTPVAAAIDALRSSAEHVRVLGSYPVV